MPQISREVAWWGRPVATHRPDIIYTHYSFDLNYDHAIVSTSVAIACRPTRGQTVKTLLLFETPSSTEWNLSIAGSFAPTWFNDVSSRIDLKCAAMKCYESELRDLPHPRSLQGIRSLSLWRGATCGYEAAEAFVLGRLID
jgi:LmbE family N-acetylglucosaminyl deacetylase